ncbi:MAG: ATP/GTP-binding protein [Proteobacteria bacterium]|nr:ATP/GTP-binding protein [Pseudomonadota bacterium]
MTKTYKLIFTGPVGAGKTTAISSISDIEIVQTEEAATDMTKKMKENTTVALDYGAIILKDQTKIHLYGTPGQKRFNFMWDILTKGGMGLLLLIDGSDIKALVHLKFFIHSFKNFIEETSIVIGITKQENNKQYELEEYQSVLSEYQPVIPIFEIDARNRKDVALMVETLLYTLDPKLNN